MHARTIALGSVLILPSILLLPALARCGDPARIDDPERFAHEFVAEHDRVRAEVDTAGAAKLGRLRWSAALADDARAVADRCRFAHSHGPHGENLYARPVPTDPETVTRAWAGEADDWSRVSNLYGPSGPEGRCAAGKMCGHYTQLIWRATTEVGCAVQRCPGERGNPFPGWDEWYLWVCHYDPPGNLAGRAPF
ncbi:CAP domain-containing protein [Nannocystaceae bacterium ST9]